MQVKTSQLKGLALNWAVAKAENHEWRCPWLLDKEGFAAWMGYELAWGNPTPDYSTDWSQGGPIIEREGIDLYYSTELDSWSAAIWEDQPGGGQLCFKQKDCPTALIAAMRCRVANEYGDTIEIPESLFL